MGKVLEMKSPAPELAAFTVEDHRHSIVYQGMDEAVADLERALVPLEATKFAVDSGLLPPCSPRIYRGMCRMLELLWNERLLRERLAALRRRDGSVEFRFSDDVWELLKN